MGVVISKVSFILPCLKAAQFVGENAIHSQKKSVLSQLREFSSQP